MAKKYYSVLTTYGAQLFASAMANRQSVHITQFAVGDGNGRTVQPDSSRTSLIKQVHRANISAISPDPRNDKQIIFELTIPENIGGFWIREMGIYDVNNRLVAYANCPETYKPLLAEGSGKIQVMRMILLVSSSNAVTLTIDDSIIFATRGQLTPLTITATSRNGINNTGHSHQIDHASLTQKGIVQLTNDTGVESEALALTAKAGKKLAQQIAQNTLAINQKVNLTGNQKIQGSKTFTGQLKAVGSLVLSSSESNNNAGHYAFLSADANTMWSVFKGHTFRWHSTGEFSVDNLRFFSELHKPRFADLLETPTTLAGYGISNFKIETFNGDINTLRTDGHFCITSAANSRNLPTQASGNLQVITGGTGNERYCHQVFWRHYSKETYARYQVSGSNDNWSAWERTDGVDWNDVRNRPTQGTASTNQRGDVLLTNDTGLDSENLALSAKGAKKLSQEIAQNRQKTVELANQKVNKSEISDAVNSDSRTQVASSKAVKTANDNANGRVSKSGDTMTGSLEINNASSFVRGKKGTANSWYVGKGSSTSDEINLYNYAYSYGIALQANRVVLGKPAYVGDKIVHHAGLDYLQTETANYGGLDIKRPTKNDHFLVESNNNQFAFIRRKLSDGTNHYVHFLAEANGTVAYQAADKATNLNTLRGSQFFKCTGDATGMPAGWDRNSDYNGIQADGDWQRFQILVASNNEMAIRVNDSESDVNAWSPWSMIANENRLTGMIAHLCKKSGKI